MNCASYFSLGDELLKVRTQCFVGLAKQVVIANGNFFVV